MTINPEYAALFLKYIKNYILGNENHKHISAQILSGIVYLELDGSLNHRQGRDFVLSYIKLRKQQKMTEKDIQNLCKIMFLDQSDNDLHKENQKEKI